MKVIKLLVLACHTDVMEKMEDYGQEFLCRHVQYNKEAAAVV